MGHWKLPMSLGQKEIGNQTKGTLAMAKSKAIFMKSGCIFIKKTCFEGDNMEIQHVFTFHMIFVSLWKYIGMFMNIHFELILILLTIWTIIWRSCVNVSLSAKIMALTKWIQIMCFDKFF